MASAEKLDLYKMYKADYVASKKPVLMRIKAASYLTVNGSGAPGGEAFTSRLGCLYNVAFTVKMTKKFAGRDYEGLKFEGLHHEIYLSDPRRVPAERLRTILRHPVKPRR